MIRRSNSREENGNTNEYYRNLFSRDVTNDELFQLSLRLYYERHLEECEDQIVPELNNNPNFMHEKDMKYRLYPFYINWKKVEANKSDYFQVFVHLGFFGAAIYSTFKEIYPSMEMKNIFHIFSSFCYEFLMNENNKEEYENEAEVFILHLPNLEDIFSLIKDKIIMFKEVPMFIMVLKIFEIYFLFKNEIESLLELLKYEYLLVSYLTDEEYKEIFQKYFKGKVNQIFKKLVEAIGVQFELPNSKKKFNNHLKYIFQGLKESISEDNEE